MEEKLTLGQKDSIKPASFLLLVVQKFWHIKVILLKNEAMVLLDKSSLQPSWLTILTQSLLPIPVNLYTRPNDFYNIPRRFVFGNMSHIWNMHLPLLARDRSKTIFDSRVINATNCLEITRWGLKDQAKYSQHFLKNTNISHQRPIGQLVPLASFLDPQVLHKRQVLFLPTMYVCFYTVIQI